MELCLPVIGQWSIFLEYYWLVYPSCSPLCPDIRVDDIVFVMRFSLILLQMAIFLYFDIFLWFSEQHWWMSSFPPMCVSISVTFAVGLSRFVKTEENDALLVIFPPFYLDMHLKTWSVNRFMLFHKLYGGCKIKFCNRVSFF